MSPDAIHSHVKTKNEETMGYGMHYAAPEIAGTDQFLIHTQLVYFACIHIFMNRKFKSTYYFVICIALVNIAKIRLCCAA